ncbi:Hypothetical predicted protein [Mytilus galloprovincialis]|uniref:Uncharacterized protein n=1 Tax=Mytilus galloprovincialis TaxID=29158 RepID=A0A8B6HHR9_MYTGA|nr:Hypothetical predicted protein [Mytilus galloprovincialis]
MGILAAVTPGVKQSISIPRINANIDDLKALCTINIDYYKPPITNKMSTMTFAELKNLKKLDPTWKLDLLCKVVWPVMKSHIPSWSGFMQMVQKREYPGQSAFTFLPMIDMDPSDLSCIYSTLKFICSQAKSYGVKAIVTFDQPLYWKALSIITNEPTTSELQSIILRLGGFHSEMSFLGSIGQLMSGSGLNEVLETVYSTNAVGHMMTGKALARAVRGHLLVDTALNALLVSMTFDIPLPDEEQYLTNEEHVQDMNQSFESNQIAETATE